MCLLWQLAIGSWVKGISLCLRAWLQTSYTRSPLLFLAVNCPQSGEMMSSLMKIPPQLPAESNCRAGEMAPRLRAHTAFRKNQSSTPSIHTRGFTTTSQHSHQGVYNHLPAFTPGGLQPPPSIHTRGFTTTITPAPGDLMSSPDLHECDPGAQTHTQTHVHHT